jgi:hypothetical protein
MPDSIFAVGFATSGWLLTKLMARYPQEISRNNFLCHSPESADRSEPAPTTQT